MNPEIVLWLALVVVFILVELAPTALVSIWLVAGAVAALLASLFTDSWAVELAVFAVVSAVALAASRPLVRRIQGGKAPDLNTGRNIGRTVVVVAASAPGRPGAPRRGRFWARPPANRTVSAHLFGKNRRKNTVKWKSVRQIRTNVCKKRRFRTFVRAPNWSHRANFTRGFDFNAFVRYNSRQRQRRR